MKQVFPALDASKHSPLPEHEFVELVQMSAVRKQVDTPPMGCCGMGDGGGSGDCGG
jgi:hypothetical protein